MSPFFDAAWFDARLDERGLSRGDLAAVANLGADELASLFSCARAASAAEIEAFGALLGADPVEVSQRCGAASRAGAGGQASAATARIESIEARLNEIDRWLAELEAPRQRA